MIYEQCPSYYYDLGPCLLHFPAVRFPDESMSTNSTRSPAFAKAALSLTVSVLLPTPPFWFPIAIVFATIITSERVLINKKGQQTNLSADLNVPVKWCNEIRQIRHFAPRYSVGIRGISAPYNNRITFLKLSLYKALREVISTFVAFCEGFFEIT